MINQKQGTEKRRWHQTPNQPRSFILAYLAFYASHILSFLTHNINISIYFTCSNSSRREPNMYKYYNVYNYTSPGEGVCVSLFTCIYTCTTVSWSSSIAKKAICIF